MKETIDKIIRSLKADEGFIDRNKIIEAAIKLNQDHTDKIDILKLIIAIEEEDQVLNSGLR